MPPWFSRGIGLSATAGRQATHVAPGARSIHIPLPRGPQAIAGTTAGGVFKQTRNLITHFFTHLTTPGFSHPIAGRSIYTASNAARQSAIQQGWSAPMRHALSRPLGSPCLPRPSPVMRTTMQVGFNTARNFSTTRPIFQHLVENVPVAGRSFFEAPAKLKRKAEMKENLHATLHTPKGSKARGSKSMMKPSSQQPSIIQQELELEHYFPTSAAPALATYLSIPLAPTPTARFPLPSEIPDGPLLPLSALAHIHASHSMHAMRVSSLFARLDAGRVWARGATCAAYGDRSGLCTVLRITFEGWTAQMVRDVIGEGGRGWCELEEVCRVPDDTSDTFSDSGNSSILSGLSFGQEAAMESLSQMPGLEIDPADSFVLPRLDFSSSFTAANRTYSPFMSTPPSPASSSCSDMSLSDVDVLSDEDMFGDVEGSVLSSGSWTRSEPVGTRSTSPVLSGSWMGFSSDFSRQVEGRVF